MKLSCLQENLAKGLGIAGRAVPSRTTMPILGNVLLATDHGQLKLAATNLELSIVHWVGGRVETEGSLTVPARNFIDLVNSLPPDQVQLVMDELSDFGRVSVDRGLVVGRAGNISARLSDDEIIISKRRSCLDRLGSKDLVRCSLATGDWEGDVEPSTETPMHRSIYLAQPQAQAILHSSPFYATLVACADVELPLDHGAPLLFWLEQRFARVNLDIEIDVCGGRLARDDLHHLVAGIALAARPLV